MSFNTGLPFSTPYLFRAGSFPPEVPLGRVCVFTSEESVLCQDLTDPVMLDRKAFEDLQASVATMKEEISELKRDNSGLKRDQEKDRRLLAQHAEHLDQIQFRDTKSAIAQRVSKNEDGDYRFRGIDERRKWPKDFETNAAANYLAHQGLPLEVHYDRLRASYPHLGSVFTDTWEYFVESLYGMPDQAWKDATRLCFQINGHTRR